MPNSDIPWVLDDLKTRRKTYVTYEAYTNGDHPLNFATERFRNTFGNLVQKLKDNLCPAVIDAYSNRLRINAFDGKDGTAAIELWTDPVNRLPRIASEVHFDAFKYGDAYLVIWPGKDNKARYWQHDPTVMTVRYDEEDDPGKIDLAGKVWSDRDKYGRCTLFYDDHIEWYKTRRTIAEGNPLPDRVDDWIFQKGAPNPYEMVPVFHFASGGKIGQMGHSELEPVIPLQDALNKSLCDMMVNDEYMAFPQRWATGLEVEVDPDTGKVKEPPFTPGADRVWTGGPDVKFGQFTAMAHDSYISLQESLRTEIARVSGLPVHMILPDKVAPSGEALKVSEGRMVKKIEARQISFGDQWIHAQELSLKINDSKDKADVSIVWANAAPHNPLLDAETQLVLEQVGLSTHQSLKELGYSEPDIEKIMKEKLDEAAAQMQMVNANTPEPIMPDGSKVTPQKGKPTAFTRNGSPGQASKPAPQKQQQAKNPIPGRLGQGQYSD